MQKSTTNQEDRELRDKAHKRDVRSSLSQGAFQAGSHVKGTTYSAYHREGPLSVLYYWMVTTDAFNT